MTATPPPAPSPAQGLRRIRRGRLYLFLASCKSCTPKSSAISLFTTKQNLSNGRRTNPCYPVGHDIATVLLSVYRPSRFRQYTWQLAPSRDHSRPRKPETRVRSKNHGARPPHSATNANSAPAKRSSKGIAAAGITCIARTGGQRSGAIASMLDGMCERVVTTYVLGSVWWSNKHVKSYSHPRARVHTDPKTYRREACTCTR